MSKIKYLFATFLAVAAFSSCVNDFDNVPEDLVIIPEGDPRAWKANMTIWLQIMKKHTRFPPKR